MEFTLFVETPRQVIIPETVSAQWETGRVALAGRLAFSADFAGAVVEKGRCVRLQVGGAEVFSGFIFTVKRGEGPLTEVVAYDQLRYLKNRSTYIYTQRRAGDVIRMIAGDFELRLGEIAETAYMIPERIEDNVSLFGVIYNALALETVHTGRQFTLYDKFGALTLTATDDMKIPVVIHDGAAGGFSCETSLNGAFNRIKLVRNNRQTGGRDTYVAQCGENTRRWGVLQRLATLHAEEDGPEKAAAMLAHYNVPSRHIRIYNAPGDVRVRAGTLPWLALDALPRGYTAVERCVHTFDGAGHRMDLELQGAAGV